MYGTYVLSFNTIDPHNLRLPSLTPSPFLLRDHEMMRYGGGGCIIYYLIIIIIN